MSEQCLKDIIVTLIENGYFHKYESNIPENLARDIVKFEKEYYKKFRED